MKSSTTIKIPNKSKFLKSPMSNRSPQASASPTVKDLRKPSNARHYMSHNFNPLVMVSKKETKNNKASIDWQEYAEMRIPYLPSIFKNIEQTNELQHSEKDKK